MMTDCQGEHIEPRGHENLVYVRGIELDAKWLRRSAEDLKRHAKFVRAFPGTETRAEDALSAAELSLMEALLEVRQAKKLFEE